MDTVHDYQGVKRFGKPHLAILRNGRWWFNCTARGDDIGNARNREALIWAGDRNRDAERERQRKARAGSHLPFGGDGQDVPT